MTVIASPLEEKRRKQREATARYREKYPDRVKASAKKSRPMWNAACARRKATPTGWAKMTAIRIRHRARRQGISFDITWEDILPPTHCPVLGMPLKLTGSRSNMNWDSPSVNRFDNTKGYIKGNVRVISNRANILKKDATVDEIRALCAYMEGLQPRL